MLRSACSLPARSGFIQSTILLFLLPLLLFAGLALLQLSAVRTAQQRVLAAAQEGAECGCRSGSLAEVHRAAGLTLGHLGGDYQTEFDFIDTDANGSEDSAAVGVTIPMNAISTNYLGLFCGTHVDDLRLRQVVVIPCGFSAGVLFDVSSNASLQQDDAWGINFRPLPPGDMTDVKIVQVEIELLPPGNQDTGNDAMFDFFGANAPVDCLSVTTPPVISDSSPQQKVAGQNDVFGLNAGALTCSSNGLGEFRFFNDQVEFVFDVNQPSKLIINFSDNSESFPPPNPPFDGGFQPGDRIRFGAKVKNLDDTNFTPNNSVDDGDEIGRVGVQVTVTFSLNNLPQAPPSVGTFIDSNFRGVGANHPPGLDPTNPANLPFVLPLAPASGNNNDDQSYLLLER
jgi:hypothetical protein